MPVVNFTDAINAYANAGRVAGTAAPTAGAAAGESFGDLLKSAAGNVVDTMAKGEQASLQAVTGKADLAQVTQAVSNAEVAVQTVVALRDRVISAYQDIMRMPM
jgi:flagellar hook-basal body complex protein FliE